jgi:hypothetical protein
MAGAFCGYGISAFIGVNRMIAEKLDVGFIQYQHIGGKHKNGIIIYLAMSIKPPGEKWEAAKHRCRYEE